MRTTDLIKESFNHSSWRGGFLQNASETEDFESDPEDCEVRRSQEARKPR